MMYIYSLSMAARFIFTPGTERLGTMDIERWLNKEIAKITTTGRVQERNGFFYYGRTRKGARTKHPSL